MSTQTYKITFEVELDEDDLLTIAEDNIEAKEYIFMRFDYFMPASRAEFQIEEIIEEVLPLHEKSLK